MTDAAPVRSLVAREALQALSNSALRRSSLASVVVGGTDRQREALPMTPPLSLVLPEGGFPQGSVVELASPGNLGHGVSVALAACAAGQEVSRRRDGDRTWCAFLDPDHTLFGPAVQERGVCLERLLVLRPPRSILARVAIHVALSRIFSVIVIDVSSIPGASSKTEHRFESMEAWSKATRRLALAIEKTPTTLFLLTRSEAFRPISLPVAMRVELENEGPTSLVVRVAKEKYGRITRPRQIAWTRPSELSGEPKLYRGEP